MWNRQALELVPCAIAPCSLAVPPTMVCCLYTYEISVKSYAVSRSDSWASRRIGGPSASAAPAVGTPSPTSPVQPAAFKLRQVVVFAIVLDSLDFVAPAIVRADIPARPECSLLTGGKPVLARAGGWQWHACVELRSALATLTASGGPHALHLVLARAREGAEGCAGVHSMLTCTLHLCRVCVCLSCAAHAPSALHLLPHALATHPRTFPGSVTRKERNATGPSPGPS